MAYATKQDLVARFGERELVQLTDRTHVPPTTVDDAVLATALDDAASEIDGYLRKVARLPLAAVPAVVTRRAVDIAMYYLRGKSAGKDDQATRAYGEAVRWLRDVAAGLTMLDEEGVVAEPAADQAGRVTGSTPALTRDSLRGF